MLRQLRNLHKEMSSNRHRDNGGSIRYIVGDADTNNSVIHEYEVTQTLIPIHDQDASQRFSTDPTKVLSLCLSDQFSGGCGTCGPVGSRLAESVTSSFKTNVESLGDNADYAAILVSAGGGTGGGAGPVLAREINGKHAYIFAVLPGYAEIGYGTNDEASGALTITAEDSFQASSAGRFLTDYLRNPYCELVVVSGASLCAPNSNISYDEALSRLDRYTSRVSLLLNGHPAQVIGSRRELSAVGYSTLTSLDENLRQEADIIAFALVSRALSPIDYPLHNDGLDENLKSVLGRIPIDEPCGLSALPVRQHVYSSELAKFMADFKDWNQPRPPTPDSPSIKALRCTRTVNAFLLSDPNYSEPEKAALANAIRKLLYCIFGDKVELRIHSSSTDEASLVYRESSHSLLLYLDSPIVEDVWRLISYYSQSSFDWEGFSSTADVARIMADCLSDDKDRPSSIEMTEELKIETTDSVNALKSRVEEFVPRFWGNFDPLSGYIDQALDGGNDISMKKLELLSLFDVSKALDYLKEQLQHERQKSETRQRPR